MIKTDLTYTTLDRIHQVAAARGVSPDDLLNALLDDAAPLPTAIPDPDPILASVLEGYFVVDCLCEVIESGGNPKMWGMMADDAFRARCQQVIDLQETVQFIYQHDDRWLNVYIVPMPDAFFVGFRDVSNQIQREQIYYENNKRLRVVVDNTPVILYTLDTQGNFTYSAGKGLARIGLRENEVVGQNALAMYANNPDVRNALVKALTGEDVHIRVVLEGTPYDMWCVPMYDAAGTQNGVMGVSIDLTEHMQAEQAEHNQQYLREENQNLRDLNAMKSRFMEMVSHEFRTPLAAIQTSADILTRYAGRLTDEQRAARLTNINQQVNHLRQMLEQTEDLLRANIEPPVALTQSTNLDKLVADLVADCEHANVTYHVEGTPRHVPVDHQLMRQMITHLIQNAVKYSPAGSPIEVSQYYTSDCVYIAVRDFGMGISEDDLKYVFEPFFRGSNADTIPGTGLGLSMVRHAVAAHNGDVFVYSNIEQGTVVLVQLPCPAHGALRATAS